MEAFDMVSCFDDKLLDFDDEENNKLSKEFAEEELEWLSNKDAFPAVETSFVGIVVPTSKHQSPVSVLDNSNNSNNSASNKILTNRNNIVMYWCDKVPVKARSKHVRKCRDMSNQENKWWVKENVKNGNGGGGAKGGTPRSRCLGRKCQHCGAEKTPQWRAGPSGPKTLCNACGVRFKSGRLVPEYRPASSPTFSEELHSNSHRKILEMRKHKQVGFSAMKPMDKG